MKHYTQITNRYIKIQRKRTILTIIGIIMAVALISGVGTILSSFRATRIEDAKRQYGNYEVGFTNVSADQIDQIRKHVDFKDISVSKAVGIAKIYEAPENKRDKYAPVYRYLSLNAYDKESIDRFYVKLTSGRYPKNENEIAISKDALIFMDKGIKLGDKISLPFGSRIDRKTGKEYTFENIYIEDEKFIDRYKKEFTIVGFINSGSFSSSSISFNAITYWNNRKTDDNNYTVYMNVVSPKNKREIALNAAENFGIKEGHVLINDNLFRLYLQSKNVSLNDTLTHMVMFIITLIMVCTIVVIYNSFNISVIERMSKYGLLRSIGATPYQIRKIVFKEAFLMSIIAIPLGLLSGIYAIKIVASLLGSVSLLSAQPFKVSVNSEVLIISTVLGIITVFLSALFPAIMAGRISPMEAIRNSTNIKKEKIRHARGGRIYRLLFKIEGKIAYCNVKRNKKRFILTTFSLVISIVMFITFNNIMSYARFDEENGVPRYYDVYCMKHLSNETEQLEFTTDEIDDIKKFDGIEKIYSYSSSFVYLSVPKQNLNTEYTDLIKEAFNDTYDTYDSQNVIANGNLCSYNDSAIELCNSHLISGKIDRAKLDNMGVIIVNRNKVKINKKHVIADFTRYKVGDEIKILKLQNYSNEELSKKLGQKSNDMEYHTLKILGILDLEPLNYSNPEQSMDLIVTENVYKKIIQKNSYSGLMLKTNEKADRDMLEEYFLSKQGAISYNDIKQNTENRRHQDFEMSVFVYGFISVITLIGAINIINTISTNLLLRRREFATIKAIGGTQAQIKKLVLLEGTLHGVIASIIGGIIGTLLSYWFNRLALRSFEMAFAVPWKSIFIATTGAVLTTLLASFLPLRKINGQNIIDNIRMEE